MSDAPSTRLRDVLKRASRVERVNPETAYTFAGTYSYGRGVFKSYTKPGIEFGLDKVQRLRTGDFVYCKIMAWEGAFGIADLSVDQCVVSQAFVIYEPNLKRICPEYLSLFFQLPTHWLAIGGQSTGTNVRRRSLDPETFENAEIPLPTLDEQVRIADKIKSALRLINEAKALVTDNAQDFDRLLVAMAHRDDLSDEEKVARGWRRVRLGDVMRLDLDPVKVDPSDAYPNLGIYSFAKGLFHKPPISGLETSAPTLYRVKAGQFIYSRLFAFEGSYGFVSSEFDGKFVSGEYPTFTCDPTQCRAEFVYAHFKPKRIWESLSSSSKGLGLRRQRVQAPAILAHEVWLPPMSEQNKIAEVLNAKRQYDALDTFEKDAEALRRSILSKAFRGEL
jgi:type I restriction enzyme S subunit